METFCLGCGEDLCDKSSDRRRLTTTDAGRHVILSLKPILEKKLRAETSVGIDCDDLVDDIDLMCRSCFSAYERYSKLLTNIEKNLDTVIEKVSTLGTVLTRTKFTRLCFTVSLRYVCKFSFIRKQQVM